MAELPTLVITFKARAMKGTKNFWSIMTDEIGWGKKTAKQKFILVWFILSFVLLCICGESLLLAAIGVANFGFAAHYLVKHVPMEDE